MMLMFIDGITPPKNPKQPTKIRPSKTDEDELSIEEPVFEPPEMVAEAGDATIEPAKEDKPASPFAAKGAAPVSAKKSRFHLSKKQIIILGVVLALMLGGGGVAAYKLTHKKKVVVAPIVQKAVEKPVEPPKPTTVASPLTGIEVKPELAQLPVTGIMIENSPDARPQSGLKDAGIVYEAIAEGGITRFLTLFQESQPDYVGPVRSARPYYLEWLQGYDAAIAHVGGSPEALNLIKSAGIKDLDQFYNSGAYHRITTRYAPHNVYTSLGSLIDLEKSKGYTTSKFQGFARKVDKPSATPGPTSIDLTLSGYLYNVHYDYNAATNSYKRSEGGKPHTDEKSGTQLEPKVVIALIIPYAIKADGLHSDYSTTGSGKAFVFQDGTITVGGWSKASSKDPLLIKDSTGAIFPLNAGQTWITVLGTEGSVAYK